MFTGSNFKSYPQISLANTTISAGAFLNRLMYWDMGVINDTSLSITASANDTLIYSFGITLPSNFNMSSVYIIVEQNDSDFIDYQIFMPIPYGVRSSRKHILINIIYH